MDDINGTAATHERDVLTDVNFRASVTLGSADALTEGAGRAAVAERLASLADPAGSLRLRVLSVDSIVVNTPKGGGGDFETWDSGVFDGDGRNIGGRRFKIAETGKQTLRYELHISDGARTRHFASFSTFEAARGVGQLWTKGGAADVFEAWWRDGAS